MKVVFKESFAMFLSALLILASCGFFGSVSGSPAVEEAYQAVISVVSPGQQNLTYESLRSLFNTLEKRVQCGEVPCEKVSFIRLNSAAREPGGRSWRGRGLYVIPKCRPTCTVTLIHCFFFN